MWVFWCDDMAAENRQFDEFSNQSVLNDQYASGDADLFFDFNSGNFSSSAPFVSNGHSTDGFLTQDSDRTNQY